MVEARWNPGSSSGTQTMLLGSTRPTTLAETNPNAHAFLRDTDRIGIAVASAATPLGLAEDFDVLRDPNASTLEKGAALLDGVITLLPGVGVLRGGAKAGAEGATAVTRSVAKTAEGASRELHVATSEVKFSQSTVSPNFSDGGTITKLVDDFRSGAVSVGDVPTIRVVEHEGKLVTLDNRRLLAFSQAGFEKVPVQLVSMSDPAIAREFGRKFNPIGGVGQHIVVTPADGRKAAEGVLRASGLIR